MGECKYSVSQKGLSVLHDLQDKSEALRQLTGSVNVYYIIFGAAGFTPGLFDEASKNKGLTLIGM